MIEIIDGVAYLKDIKSPEQSLDMFKWLKENASQRLYLIKGVNTYGCGLNGELVKIENMPSELVDNGFCINPSYVGDKPLNEPTSDKTTTSSESSEDIKSCDTTPFESHITYDEYIVKVNELELALDNAIKERDMYVNLYNELSKSTDDNKYLEDKIAQLSNKLECLETEYNNNLEKLYVAEGKLSTSAEDKIDRTDIRGLCKALYDLGFDVELGFCNEDIDK